jgi:hypothetical protein
VGCGRGRGDGIGDISYDSQVGKAVNENAFLRAQGIYRNAMLQELLVIFMSLEWFFLVILQVFFTTSYWERNVNHYPREGKSIKTVYSSVIPLFLQSPRQREKKGEEARFVGSKWLFIDPIAKIPEVWSMRYGDKRTTLNYSIRTYCI